MSVAAGTGTITLGATLVAPAVAGGAANAAGVRTTPATVVSATADSLAFTGASHLVLMTVVGLIFIMAGLLMLGFVRHVHVARRAASVDDSDHATTPRPTN